MNLGGRIKVLRMRRGWQQVDVADRVPGLSQQALQALERRDSRNSKFAPALADLFGVPLTALITGRGFSPDSSVAHGSESHAVSLAGLKMPPTTIAWEALMTADLAEEFETSLPDDAMAPHAPKGTRVIFVRSQEAQPGDWILLRDREGHHYCREYRQHRPGQWQAHAVNPAFLPLDSEADGLQVVALFDGMRGRRSPR